VKQAIGRHLRDFIAGGILALIGLAVAIYILGEQEAPFPSWVPAIGQERFELQAEFSSAQAVTPGQGQSVNLAGVDIGEIAKVELVDGRAQVTMDIAPEYRELIHPDASLLMRPRTGLQDMTVQLDPGTDVEVIEPGATIPLASTKPNVNVDQILASLDADTRTYLRMLLSGGAEGLEGNERDLAATFKRFEPTARDLARINGELAKRRENLARVVHNFGQVAEEVGNSDAELSRFIASSNEVFDAFAQQEDALRGTLQEAPAALRETQGALEASDRLSAELTPTLRELIPQAQALTPALRETSDFFDGTLVPVREQIRPFTRQVREPFEHLGRAADPLAESSEGLRGAFSELNYLLDTLAYNPPGQAEEGYLFWASWLNHNLNAGFRIQDAHGPLRRAMVLMSCASAGFAEGVTASRPLLLTLQQLTRIPITPEIPGCL
jgi:phospholipid/cholesterol/gamma-HCH transport system substrate-binding protein